MLQLKSPNAKYITVFSNPAASDNRDGTPWTSIAVREGADETLVENFRKEEPGSAVLPLPDARNRWSPDGRYIVVIVAANVKTSGEMGQQTYRFVDLEEADWATFKAGSQYAGVDNFIGWKTHAPHTMLISSGNAVKEALPGK